MALCVCNGAKLKCSFGAAPANFNVLPLKRVFTSSQPTAVITDNIPYVNVMPFGLCSAPTNPAVIAALGAPQPCIPVTAIGPWITGAPSVLLGNIPALNNTSKLFCMWLGIITVLNPGQKKAMVP